jgi:hypothetical protein
MCSKVVLETISRQPNLQSFKIHQVDPQQDTGCTPNPLTDSNTFIMKKHTIKFGIWGWSFQPPQPHLWQFKAWAERTAGCFQQHCKKIHQVRLPSLNIVAGWKIENGKPKRKLYEIVISLQAMWQKNMCCDVRTYLMLHVHLGLKIHQNMFLGCASTMNS